MPDPIRVLCEGRGFRGNNPGRIGASCAMCGQWMPLTAEGVMPDHERDDVLAMIDRGDFG